MELAPISGAFAGILSECVGKSELVAIFQQICDGLDGDVRGLQKNLTLLQLHILDVLFGGVAYLSLEDAAEIAAVNAQHVGQGGYDAHCQ